MTRPTLARTSIKMRVTSRTTSLCSNYGPCLLSKPADRPFWLGHRADLDGSNVEDLLGPGVLVPGGSLSTPPPSLRMDLHRKTVGCERTCRIVVKLMKRRTKPDRRRYIGR